MRRSAFRFLPWLAACVLTLCGGCRSPVGRILQRGGPLEPAAWSAEETSAPLAARTIREQGELRFLHARLNAAEETHSHASDATVFVLAGHGRIHFSETSFEFRAGDVLELPAGEEHWAEPLGSASVEAYIVFTPTHLR